MTSKDPSPLRVVEELYATVVQRQLEEGRRAVALMFPQRDLTPEERNELRLRRARRELNEQRVRDLAERLGVADMLPSD